MRLLELGFKLDYAQSDTFTFRKVVDEFEELEVTVNFKDNTVMFRTYMPDNQSGSRYTNLEAPLELLEASLELLKSRKVEFNYE